MISFRDSIQNRHLNEAAAECFTLMIDRGIDPDSFIEWLSANIESEQVSENCFVWLEASMREVVEEGVGDMFRGLFAKDTSLKKAVSDAIYKLNDLLARGQRQNSRLNKKELEEMMRGMVAILKHMPVPEEGRPVPPGPVPPVPPGPVPPVPPPPPHESVTFAQKKLLETRLRMACVLLYEMGANPVAFAEWATSEESVCEASDWLGGAWAGLKGGLAGGWDELMRGGAGGFFGGFRKGWRSSRDTKYDQYDIQAIDDAMKHFQDLANRLPGPEHAELNTKIAQLIDNLKKVSAEKPPVIEPEEPLDAQKQPVDPEKDPKVLEFMKDYKPTLKGKTSIITKLQPVWEKLPENIKREFAIELQKVIPIAWKPGMGLTSNKKIIALYKKHYEGHIKNLITPPSETDSSAS